MNKYKFTAIFLVLLIIVLVVTSGVWSKRNHVISIGVLASLTGPGAYFGEQFVSGLKLAVTDINNLGGINGVPIKLIVEDSQTNDVQALSAVKKLIEYDKVKVVLGDSWNSTTLAVYPYLMDKKVILISPWVSLDSFSKDDYAFRLIPSNKEFVGPLAEYAMSQGWGRAAFARAENQFGEEHASNFRSYFEKAGGIIVSDQSFDGKSNDLRSELTRIKSTKPDVIFNLHLSGPSVGFLMKQAQEVGIKSHWFATWSAENSALSSQYGPIIEGLIYPAFYNTDESSTTKQFTQRIKDLKKTNDMFIALGYDTLRVIETAIKTTRSISSEELKKSLLSIKDYRGVSGTFGFDSNGDVKRSIFLKTYKNREFVKLSQ